MYYEKRKNYSFAIALILFFLVIIILILLNLIGKIDNNKNQEIALTGTDTVLTEFNLQDLAKNAGYSVVRCFKNK